MVQLVRSRFYREHVFPHVSELGSASRDGAMLMAMQLLFDQKSVDLSRIFRWSDACISESAQLQTRTSARALCAI